MRCCRLGHLIFFPLILLLLLADPLRAFPETRGCNRTVRNSVGWIRWTGRMGRCVVRIRAPTKDPTQMIEMRIRRMQVGVLRNSRCEGAYVQFFNEPGEDFDESSTSSGGRYCGHVTGNTTRLFLRRGPDLTVVLDSEIRFAAENPVIFSAQFSILPSRLANERHHVQQTMSQDDSVLPGSLTECPLECQQRNDRRTCRLVSPGYPGVYPRGIRCRVALESGAGRFRIGGTAEDNYSLMNHTSQEACKSEFCEQEHVHVQEQPQVQNDQAAPVNLQDQQQQQKTHLSKMKSDRDEEDEIIIGGQPLLPEASPTKLKKPQHHHRRRSRGQHHRPREDPDDSDDKPRSKAQKMRHHRRNGEDSSRLHLPTDLDEEDPDEDDEDEDEDDDLYDDDDEDEDEDLLSKPKKHHRNNQLFWSKNKSNNERSSSMLYNHPNPHHHQQHQERTGRAQQQRRRRPQDVSPFSKLGSTSCVGDYLALLESVNGRLLEIGKFCGEGRVPQILSRGRNVIVEFHAERDGTIMHDGFHLTIQESEAPPVATALAAPAAGTERQHYTCDFLYRSSERARDTVKSPRSWYPPNTLCSYRFTGKPNERVSVLLKIIREEAPDEDNDESSSGGHHHKGQNSRRNDTTLDYCPGNELAVYNGTQVDGSFLMWSFCDATHSDINNIQVPIVSTGNTLLIQFYSATGSYNGQDFTYSITYKFMRKPAVNATKRRQAPSSSSSGREEEFRGTISLRPVDFNALNLTDPDNCNCDFADRIGNFKSWFIVLVVLGVISFLGAIVTIIVLLVKCAKSRSAEKKLLQTPQRAGSSLYYKTSVIID